MDVLETINIFNSRTKNWLLKDNNIETGNEFSLVLFKVCPIEKWWK